MLSRKLVLGVADLGMVRRVISSRGVYDGFVRRFVAGQSLPEAIGVVRELHALGLRISFDFLGESVTDARLARAVADEYRRILSEGLPEVAGLDATVSVKLTQLGMDVDRDLCAEHVRELLRTARANGGRMIRLDMEDHTYVDSTLALYEEMRAEGFDNIGVVLQAYLRRTPDDLERLRPHLAAVRLCKGAYLEPPEVAFPRMSEVNDAYLRIARTMLEGGFPSALATHDPAMIQGVKRIVRDLGLRKDQFEFQMLYGIGREHQRNLVHDGFGMRVYVPYGSEWYAYFSRRLAERPANMWFIARNLFRR